MDSMIPSHTTTSSFKSKWNSIKSWFSIPDLSKRRPSECSTASSCSCATIQDSPVISYLPLKRPSFMDISSFRKRPSLADIKSYSPFHKQPPPTTTTTKTLIDIDQVIALYNLALDELNYAQDSLGSPYYLGDRQAAQEAIENCEEAYSLKDSPPDDDDLTLKIYNLKSKLNSLPLVQEEQEEDQIFL